LVHGGALVGVQGGTAVEGLSEKTQRGGASVPQKRERDTCPLSGVKEDLSQKKREILGIEKESPPMFWERARLKARCKGNPLLLGDGRQKREPTMIRGGRKSVTAGNNGKGKSTLL